MEITGFRDSFGRWNHREQKAGTGRWYVGASQRGQRHRGQRGGPVDQDLAEGRQFTVQIDYNGNTYFYTYKARGGITGAKVARDFRAKLRSGYFQRHGTVIPHDLEDEAA